MKNILYTIAICLVSNLVLAQSQTENYIKSTTTKVEVQSETALNNLSAEAKLETITYFDGLGRAIQSISVQAGGQGQDIITPFGYDGFGRQVKDYLPFARLTSSLDFDTSLIPDTNGDNLALNNFYRNKYPNEWGPNDIPNPFSEKMIEPSPLNRVLKQAAPGEDWKRDNGHEIEMEYSTNSSTEVQKYYVTITEGTSNNITTFTPSLELSSYYGANELYKTITKDENHDGSISKDHTTEEFKDKQGRVILKRTYNNEVAHDTYYVYDDYGNLTYVLPPKVNPQSGIPNAGKLRKMCYQYVYDNRNRLVEKRIPGKEWEHIVYDKQDRPIMSRDGIITADQEVLFTSYDVFGRVAYTGILDLNQSTSRTALQDFANMQVANNVDRSTNPRTLDNTTIYYYDMLIPSGATYKDLHTINYYDDYNFDLSGITPPTDVFGVVPTTQTKGLSTGSKVRVLDNEHWITTVTWYDDKGRAICTISKNSYLQTTDTVKLELDFEGKVIRTESTHVKGSNDAIVIEDDFTYDHVNRLLTQVQSVDGSDQELIVNNHYDELGQLTEKRVGGLVASVPEQSVGLQTIDYDYNIRGWLKTINDPSSLGNDLFAFKINYRNIEMGTGNPLYNGNIKETIWKTANDGTTISRGYAYNYDDLNRLTKADYGVNSSGAFNRSLGYEVKNIQYDKNGNIKFLERQGEDATDGWIDRLTYKYNGNQLKKVTDAASGNIADGFKDGANDTIEYIYDDNGNMVEDKNKGITSILYNHLNLPTFVTLSGGNIQYIYDATGVKLKKIVSTGANTEYAGNFIYENGDLQFFSHPEGYAQAEYTSSGSGGGADPGGNPFDPTDPGDNPFDTNELSGFSYVYQYKDHLGNIRLSYADTNADGSITVSTDPNTNEIIEENNYYPFGLEHKGYNNNVSANSNSAASKFKFGGKEYNEELGLDWYDVSARNYDPALGRWMNLDPLAEQMRRHSPYNYGFDNPIFFTDPDGMKPCPTGVNCDETETEPEDVKRARKKIEDNKVVKTLDNLFSMKTLNAMGNSIMSLFEDKVSPTIDAGDDFVEVGAEILDETNLSKKVGWVGTANTVATLAAEYAENGFSEELVQDGASEIVSIATGPAAPATEIVLEDGKSDDGVTNTANMANNFAQAGRQRNAYIYMNFTMRNQRTTTVDTRSYSERRASAEQRAQGNPIAQFWLWVTDVPD